MKIKQFISGLALGVTFLTGCEDKETVQMKTSHDYGDGHRSHGFINLNLPSDRLISSDTLFTTEGRVVEIENTYYIGKTVDNKDLAVQERLTPNTDPSELGKPATEKTYSRTRSDVLYGEIRGTNATEEVPVAELQMGGSGKGVVKRPDYEARFHNLELFEETEDSITIETGNNSDPNVKFVISKRDLSVPIINILRNPESGNVVSKQEKKIPVL